MKAIKLLVSAYEASGKTTITSKIKDALVINFDRKEYGFNVPHANFNNYEGMSSAINFINEKINKYKDNKETQIFLRDFEKSYKKEHNALKERIIKTENLAAVGLSIETASHDVMLFLRKTLEQQDAIIKDLMMGGFDYVKNYGLRFFISNDIWNIKNKFNQQYSVVPNE